MARCPTCHRRLAPGRPCARDGGIAPASSAVRIGNPSAPNIPGYTVGALLGAGGFAAVWSATRNLDGTAAALKVGHRTGSLGTARLEREADALSRIGPPHTPAYVEHGVTPDGIAFLAMEPIADPTLATVIADRGQLPQRSIRRAVDAILRAVAAAHVAGVVHRDLKPENILGDVAAGRARLIDFGLARATAPNRDRLTRTGVVLGTAEYMAPEQIAGCDVDERADIYAFGAILYELLTGRPPFVGDLASIEHGHSALRPRRPSQLADVPDHVERIALRCLAKSAADRPASASAVRRELRRAWGTGTTEASRRTTGATSLLVGKREPAVVLAVDLDDVGIVDACVRYYGGFVARHGGARVLSVFPAGRSTDPIDAALDAARELADQSPVAVAVHLASLVVRRRRRGPPNVVGEAVDRADTWLPRAPWTGTLLTAAVVHTGAAGPTVESTAHPGFHRRGRDLESDRICPLVGRDAVLATARAMMRECVESRTPALLTIIGAPGAGKSRIAAELVQMCSGVDAAVRTSSIRGGGATSDRDLLGAVVADATVRAVVVDDAHRLDAETLDAVEYATLDHGDVPLCVVAIGDPALERVRSRWGMRANRHVRVELDALDEPAAMAMAAELLRPADYPPAAFLRRLVEWSRGVPAVLFGLVAELKRQGMVRRRDHGDGWYVAAGEFEQLPPQAAEQWLAGRELAAMTPELAACARVCAVLGDTLDRAELGDVLDAIDRAGGAATTMDAGVGIDRLVARGALVRLGARRYAFASAAFRRAMYDALEPDDRAHIHRCAAELWRARRRAGGADADSLARLARHAAAGGLHAEAAELYVALGERAARRHRSVEADQHFSAALAVASCDRVRLRGLAGRARARGELHRTGEALADAETGLGIATRLECLERAADLWLVQALIADSAGDYEHALLCTTRATAVAAQVGDSTLTARVALAEGRVAWRSGDAAAAVPLLRDAATATAETDTRVHATLLLAPALVATHQLDAAEAAFESVIELCRETGDRLHECAAYCNRMFLWSARQELGVALDDLRRSVDIARELGNPEPERVATHNLAEILYWSGDVDKALPLAERGLVLQQRFWEHTPHDALLLARVCAALGHTERVRALVDWIDSECDPAQFGSVVAILLDMLRLLLDEGSSSAWSALLERADRELPALEWLELTCWRVDVALAGNLSLAEQILSTVDARLAEAPLFASRVRSLRDRLARLRHPTETQAS